MKAIISILSVFLLAPAARAQAPAPKAASTVLKAATDRPNAMYRAGEGVRFTIQSSDAVLKSVKVILSQDGWKPQPPKDVALEGGRGVLEARLEGPGFLQARVSAAGLSGAVLAAAACEPEKIPPSMTAPDDFDAFWAAQKAALAKVPAKAALAPVATTVKGTEAFDVQVDCLGGKPASGYFGRPKGAKPKSLPAVLLVHGAGVRSSNPGSVSWAANGGGMLSFDLNAHGIPNGKPAEFYTALQNGELKDYRIIGNKDREQCYFRGMFLRLVRAIDFLTAQPEWDGRTVIVYGSSQGGFQAFAAAGLDERVSFICAGVPAGCDHTGSQMDRISGWPKIVTNGPDGKPDPAALQTSRYFDCVNFARRCHAKGAVVTVGFIDTTCPPTSVYAAYNALTIPKRIHGDVLAGHTNTPDASKFMLEAALAHAREMR